MDLADVGFVDARGINALVRCRAQTVAAGCRLVVTNPQPIVYQVLRITGMLEALAVAPDRIRHNDQTEPPATEQARRAHCRASALSGARR
jgi:anti-anti-sigma regulatory factor